MKRLLLIFSSFLIFSCSQKISHLENSNPTVSFHIDVKNHSDDLFHVTVNVTNLNRSNGIYHFVSTVPGTYQVLDFGRFVKTFKAFDKKGNELKTEKLNVNDWKINSPEKLTKIEYDIEDSFDANVKKFPIPPMCGSGIEKDFIALNTFAVLGYFESYQSIPVKLKLNYNSDWTIGTALPKNDNGFYYADNYDHLADSPILIGKLTVAETFVENVSVQVYVYSSDSTISATTVLDLAENVLQSASSFLGYSPVSHYKFLMCLIDGETSYRNKLYGVGALEHSYSSLYVMPASVNGFNMLKSTMAHEFLHILTPLLLHSEIVHTFNFENPVPSQHIWLYESVTEWASSIMQLRAGVIGIDRYFEIISDKLRMNDRFDQNISFVDMSLSSYNKSGLGNFLNFYQKGTIMVSLLDLKLLELSNGEKGFQEVFLSLLEKYGKYKPFPEDEFFDILVQETYPEIREFIDNYIIGTEKLPYKYYYQKLGYNYIKERISSDKRPALPMNNSMNEKAQIIIVNVQDIAKSWGLKNNDVVVELLGEKVTRKNIRSILQSLYKMSVGDNYNIVVQRNDKKISIDGKLVERMEKHIFEQMDNLTDEQRKFRDVWSRNL